MIPINLIGWVFGAVVVTIFSRKSYRQYRKTNNPIHRQFGHFYAAISGVLFLYGLPPLLIVDTQLLTWVMSVANGAALLALVLLVEILAISRYMPLIAVRSLQIIITAIAVFAAVNAIMSPTEIVYTQYTTSHIVTPLNGRVQALGFMIGLMPVAWFFIHNGLRQASTYSKLKVSSIGVVFLLIGLVVMSNYGIRFGEASTAGAVINIFAFTALLTVALSPVKLTSKEAAGIRAGSIKNRAVR